MRKHVGKIIVLIVLLFACISVVNAYGEVPHFEPSNETLSCAELLGPNLVKIVHAFIKIIQLASIIIAIVYGMIMVIPAVMAHDADALNKISKKLITMAIVLLIILILPPLLRVFGNMLDYDISCIF